MPFLVWHALFCVCCISISISASLSFCHHCLACQWLPNHVAYTFWTCGFCDRAELGLIMRSLALPSLHLQAKCSWWHFGRCTGLWQAKLLCRASLVFWCQYNIVMTAVHSTVYLGPQPAFVLLCRTFAAQQAATGDQPACAGFLGCGKGSRAGCLLGPCLPQAPALGQKAFPTASQNTLWPGCHCRCGKLCFLLQRPCRFSKVDCCCSTSGVLRPVWRSFCACPV